MPRTVTGIAGLLELGPADLSHSSWLEIRQDRVDTSADATGAPFPTGSRIRAHGAIAAATEVQGGAEAVVDLMVEIEGRTKPARRPASHRPSTGTSPEPAPTRRPSAQAAYATAGPRPVQVAIAAHEVSQQSRHHP